MSYTVKGKCHCGSELDFTTSNDDSWARAAINEQFRFWVEKHEKCFSNFKVDYTESLPRKFNLRPGDLGKIIWDNK